MSQNQEHPLLSSGQTKVRAVPQLILILGGARSGKSMFAERLAHTSEQRVAFIATATAQDDDMRARIAHHRANRPQDWYTIEEPLQLAEAVQQAAQVADVLLLDCMTLWLSNWLFSQPDVEQAIQMGGSAGYSERALSEIDLLLESFTSLSAVKTLIVVSNEVGLGIVPSYALGCLYRDVLGRVNQRLASAATRVYLMVAGLGVDIKRLHEEAALIDRN